MSATAPKPNEASLAQITAADPGTSTWLSANAGSGKTRVLTDRVARLLLGGTLPERILCLTYTKAAAMEMQNRLFARLGAWAMLEDAALRETLAEVGVPSLSADVLREARTLFARAIEAPGGLKIQTIHSFCASVLRRFPLEAGVSPGFTEIDERQQTRLIEDLLEVIAEDPDKAGVVDDLAPHLSDEAGLMQLSRAVLGKSEAFEDPWDWDRICAWAEIDPSLTAEGILAQALDGSEADLVTALVPHLDRTVATQDRLAQRLLAMPWSGMDLDDLAELEAICLTMSGAKAGQPKAIANAKVRASMGDALVAGYDALAARVADARLLRLSYQQASRTRALHQFAGTLLPVYRTAKQARGWLDFDDLINRTRALLAADGVAQWVLFRLDGGIDHILVDEAQDTSPAQWEIVQQLAEDFAAGEGARADVERTIFVVGDKKQSIYSFQGADPAGFDRMRDFFDEKLSQIGAPFQAKDLIFSFRSAPPILALVDAVAGAAGAPGVGPDVLHRAFFDKMPGRVDLWPVVEPGEGGAQDPAWDDPVDLVSEDHHRTVLANSLARAIQRMLDERHPITVNGTRRAMTAGDILILVRNRSSVFRPIIAALKALGLPIAGVDRSQLDEPLAVKDLLALLRFLATPEDDLSLATVLRSPLGGWSEDALFRLAHGRTGTLYQALRARSDDWPETLEMLQDLLNQTDFLRPYDLLERVLIQHDGRRRLIARLGPEADDGIDAILAQALQFERLDVPSLTGFVGWLETGQVTVKRDLTQAKDQIRVMTVHGAKGLEAPVVILPDCAMPHPGAGGRMEIVEPEDGPVVWAKSTDATEPVQVAREAAKARDAEERNRLLYVAMTRAESWLIVAASGKRGKEPESSWYNAIETGMQQLGAAPHLVPEFAGAGLRLETGDWEVLPDDTEVAGTPEAVLPDWVARPATSAKRDAKILTPSDLGGAKALPGEGLAEADALKRGRLVHLLLEHLPRLPEPAWAEAAPGIVALEDPDLGASDLTLLLREVTTILTAPALKPLFAPDALAEVSLTGDSKTLGQSMFGVIDRLIVSERRVLAVDFKTNMTVPASADAVPEGLLRQMGAYAELLAPLYPGREIGLAILWTRTAQMMELPHDLVSQALQNARGA